MAALSYTSASTTCILQSQHLVQLCGLALHKCSELHVPSVASLIAPQADQLYKGWSVKAILTYP